MSPHENPETREERRLTGLGTLGAMLGLGLAMAWASIRAIPWLEGIGVARGLASNVPFAALACGAAWGFAMRFSKAARKALTVAAIPIVMGCVLWVFGLLVGALLLLVGAATLADHAAGVGFWLGVALGGFTAGVGGFERLRGPLSKQRE